MNDAAKALFGGAADPKAQVRKWKSDMRKEQRTLDRQMRGTAAARRERIATCSLHCPLARRDAGIQREEDKVKKSIKDAAKRGDTQTCKMLAKEIVRSRKAVNRMHTSKAQMNSVVMQMENQLGARRACGPSTASRARSRAPVA